MYTNEKYARMIGENRKKERLIFKKKLPDLFSSGTKLSKEPS
jgi:hypothetical protein